VLDTRLRGAITDRCRSPFLVATGSLLSTWLEVDLAWLDVEPATHHTDVQPLPPPEDGLGGAEAGDPFDTPVSIRSSAP